MPPGPRRAAAVVVVVVGGGVYVKRSPGVMAEKSPFTVTTTFATPARPAGGKAVMVPPLTTLTLVAGFRELPSNSTDAPEAKFVPLIVTDVADVPLAGDTAVTVGSFELKLGHAAPHGTCTASE